MKNLFETIIVAAIVSVVGAWAVYQYAPLSVWQGNQPKQLFGNTSITVIQGSDTLSGSRTTINNNFASLNTNKEEISDLVATTTLPNLAHVGTIVAGVWQGTAVGTAYGGTGSTTLSSNQVLLGNGAGSIAVVSGWGTSGQFLTSNGSTLAPTWTTAPINTTLNYNWTGTNLFKTLVSSSTIQITNGGAGASYSFPTTVGAANSVLADTAGNGTLSWSTNLPHQYVEINPNTYTATNGTNGGFATSSAMTIPASFVTASSTIQIKGALDCNSQSTNSDTGLIILRDGAGDTFGSVSCNTNSSTYSTLSGTFEIDLGFTSDTSHEATVGISNAWSTTVSASNTSGLGQSAVTNATINLSNAFSIVLVASAQAGGGTPITHLYPFSITVIR